MLLPKCDEKQSSHTVLPHTLGILISIFKRWSFSFFCYSTYLLRFHLHTSLRKCHSTSTCARAVRSSKHAVVVIGDKYSLKCLDQVALWLLLGTLWVSLSFWVFIEFVENGLFSVPACSQKRFGRSLSFKHASNCSLIPATFSANFFFFGLRLAVSLTAMKLLSLQWPRSTLQTVLFYFLSLCSVFQIFIETLSLIVALDTANKQWL